MVNARSRRRSEGSTPWKPEADDPRSAEIRDVALDLVARRGYDSVTIDDIAAEARASKGTLYRRWDSKAAMVVDAVRHNTKQLEDSGDTGTLRGDLLALLNLVARELTRDADLVVALLAAARRNDELMRTVASQVREPGQAVGRLPLERAIARGELPARTDMSLVDEIAMPMLLHRVLWQEPVDDAFVTHIVDDVLLRLLPVARL
ncbi:TetR/AcrR family transcriptional regulator [Streptomyces maremycinicus]|uniref:TetR/AcrR family transcriptional regulator n=1 Tax=Streptomyces maremycinicus TaxID=1679753 RepID=UPI000786F67E|nr:TetR/AcrR family transcriptional regulator [Streptomyces sp. NBRC 110468]